MTPGSILIMSGALILILVSAYDYIAECAVAEDLRRRRLQTCADVSPGSPFATRLARYGVEPAAPAVQADDAAPTNICSQTPRDPPDLLDDLEAFHAWLLEGRGATRSLPLPVQDQHKRHHPPANALSLT